MSGHDNTDDPALNHDKGKGVGKEVNTFSIEVDVRVFECPCGSGRKPEKCCGPVKPRTHTVHLDPRNYHESEGLAIGQDGNLKRIVKGRMEPIIGLPRLSQSYPRKKSPKVLVGGEIRGGYALNPNALLLGYDYIFSIDTNTKKIYEHEISVTGVVYAILDVSGEIVNMKYTHMCALEFWDSEVNAELLGLYAIIGAIKKNEGFRDKDIAILVDANLGILDDINSRKKPILPGCMLPENIRLIYATADSGSNVVNVLMRQSDKIATQKLNEIVSSDQDKHALNETEYPCRWFRQWPHE